MGGFHIFQFLLDQLFVFNSFIYYEEEITGEINCPPPSPLQEKYPARKIKKNHELNMREMILVNTSLVAMCQNDISKLQRLKFSFDQLLSSFLNKISGSEMFQTWSKQLENEGIWALYMGFPLFSSENNFFSEMINIPTKTNKRVIIS